MGMYTVTSLADTEEKSEDISLEFLEFLADWETDQGDWVGPDSFVDDSFDQLYEVNDEQNDEENEQ